MSQDSRHDDRFRQRMRAARRFREMSQQDLADATGIPRHAITAMETLTASRHIRLGEAVTIAEALGWPLQDFIGDEPLRLVVDVAP